MKRSILIVDDDPDVLSALGVLLEDEFTHIVTERNTNRISTLAADPYDVILLDMNFSAGINTGNEGLFWLSKIRETNKQAVVILMTAYGNIQLAVEAIKRGAKDFILKPWDNEKLIATLRAALTPGKVSDKSAVQPQPVFVEGRSMAMQRLQEQVKKVAATDASVLLLGETGTGKEVIARELHRLSPRAQQVFVPVDLTTLAAPLFESELFGHRKGAFTDAKADRTGRFQSADGGTLFLDEIGNLPAAQQAKLLVVLQNRVVTPIGSDESIPVNVRLITATNMSLQQQVQAGFFRQDLLYRINTVTLTIPPLRERGDDIVMLARHFLELYKTQYNKPELVLDEEAQVTLACHTWPGNVRELQHTLEKAVILCNSSTIGSADLDLSRSAKPTVSSASLKTLEDMEREALRQALVTHEGNIVQAARTLGITRQTLYNKMKKYGI